MTFDLEHRTILLVLAGSRAYGTHGEGSDVDLKGAAIPPAASVYGFMDRFEQCDEASQFSVFRDLLTDGERVAADAHGLEGTVYDVRKLLALATQSNPNILDALFCRDAEVRRCTPLGQRLRQHRELFVTQKAKATFAGYAAAQLKRIRNHRAWLLSPPSAAPTRADFDLPEAPLVPRHQLEAAEAAIRKQVDTWELDLEVLEEPDRIALREQVVRTLGELGASMGLGAEDVPWFAAARKVGLHDDLIEALKRERAYRSARRGYRSYQHWKANRNPQRAALEARHGYDSKHGAHLVRLLRMGKEILLTGQVHVWRGPQPGGPSDADELKAIRHGAWSYEQLVEWADAENESMNRILAEGRAVVPSAPDRAAIDALCVQIVAEGLQQLDP